MVQEVPRTQGITGNIVGLRERGGWFGVHVLRSQGRRTRWSAAETASLEEHLL